MTTYRPNIKTLPFVFLAILGILFIYDVGLEQQEVSSELISETGTYEIHVEIFNDNYSKNISTTETLRVK